MNLNTQIKPILEDLNVGLIYKSLVFTILKTKIGLSSQLDFAGTLFGVKVTNKIDLDRGKSPPRQGFTLLFFLISVKATPFIQLQTTSPTLNLLIVKSYKR